MTPDLSKLKDYEYPKIAERFFVETEHHELTVLHDDGDYRHLRMMPRRPRSSAYWYEIVTWPGSLAFRGDGESYVFSIFGEDMFKLFRNGVGENGLIHINASYWAEKLSSDRDVRKYDDDKFEEFTAAILKDSEETWPGLTAAWEKATNSFMADYDIHHEAGAWEALSNFSYGESYTAKCSCGKSSIELPYEFDAKAWARSNGHQDSVGNDKPGHTVEIKHKHPFTFELSDIGDTFKDYDWWFLWSLYGIVKAIQEYDRLKGHGGPVDIAVAGKTVLV